jgi:hypothetical protein
LWARQRKNSGGRVPVYLEHDIFPLSQGMPVANKAHNPISKLPTVPKFELYAVDNQT